MPIHDFLRENFNLIFALIIGVNVFLGLRFAYAYFTIGGAVAALGKNLTDEGAEEFCRFVEGAVIPNYLDLYNKLRAGCDMVQGSRQISREMKEKVKVTLQSRGVWVR